MICVLAINNNSPAIDDDERLLMFGSMGLAGTSNKPVTSEVESMESK